MPEYISRDELLILEAILSAPAADVAEVKHGEWVDIKESELYCADVRVAITRTTETCSVCKCKVGFVGPKIYLNDIFCPACGAKMDGQ